MKLLKKYTLPELKVTSLFIVPEETMKKLLKKIEVEEADMESNLEEFERRLREVMRRYKI